MLRNCSNCLARGPCLHGWSGWLLGCMCWVGGHEWFVLKYVCRRDGQEHKEGTGCKEKCRLTARGRAEWEPGGHSCLCSIRKRKLMRAKYDIFSVNQISSLTGFFIAPVLCLASEVWLKVLIISLNCKEGIVSKLQAISLSVCHLHPSLLTIKDWTGERTNHNTCITLKESKRRWDALMHHANHYYSKIMQTHPASQLVCVWVLVYACDMCVCACVCVGGACLSGGELGHATADWSIWA